MTPRHVPITGVPQLQRLAVPTVSVYTPDAVVEVDDADDQRLRLAFSPLQAVRIRTADLYVKPDGATFHADRLVEVTGSTWLEELSADLRQVDHTATFMQRARHFLVPAGDLVIEVVAWAVEWTAAAGGGRYPD